MTVTKDKDDQLPGSTDAAGLSAKSDDNLLDEILSNTSIKIKFGLEQQGHIPVIEEMLDRHCGWDEINRKIGWAGTAASENYVRYLRKKVKELEAEKAGALINALSS